MSATALAADRVFDGEDFHADRAVIIEDGRIVAIAPAHAVTGERLPAGVTLAPGLIDTQVNGGGDALLNDDPSPATIRTIAAAHARLGTTGFLATLITDRPERMARLASIAGDACAIPGVLGFHLEGPFINPKRKGIHRADLIRPPGEGDLAMLRRFAGVGRNVVTLAPECAPDGFIAALVSSGLIVAAGHSEASAAQLARAADDGLTGVTHLFNAMPPLAGREPGIVGRTLADDRLFAGVIADGLHVDPVSVRAALRAKGRDRMFLVSDAMPSLGGEKPRFDLLGIPVELHGGRLTGPDGTLAGAHLSLIEAVRNLVTRMGVTLADALVMASRTPARLLGLDRAKGRIEAGYDADLVAFDADYRVIGAWIAGRRVTPP